MRFAKRNRPRTPINQSTGKNGSPAVGTVASEERSALLGFSGSAAPMPEPVAPADISDATQQLLTGLGRFQRELSNATDDAYAGAWSDEAMNQLISCVEIALANEWPEMVEALADTGRVLQSYEDAGRADDSLPFLNDAYEILCLMVGDLIVDTIRPTVLDQWRARYEAAVAELQRDGLVLVSDDDEDAVSNIESFEEGVTRVRGATTPEEDDSPFEMPEDDATAASDDLPALDELPSLDDVLTELPEDPVAETEEDIVEEVAEAIADEAEPDTIEAGDVSEDVMDDASMPDDAAAVEAPKPSGPSKLVVEILDQLCAQLSALETGVGEARAIAAERVTGGVRALQREASALDHGDTIDLCDSMIRAAEIAGGTADDSIRQRVAELGYAFCGAYTEALAGDTESAAAWRVECEALIAESASESTAEEEITTAATGANAKPASADAVEAEATEVAGEASETAEADPEETSATAAQSQDTSSAGLLISAQRAASLGDATNAKRLALEAAAAIARDEVAAASQTLNNSESRLRASMNATAAAREAVGHTEAVVNEAATKTHDSERSLGEKQAAKARVEQRLSDLHSNVEEIDRQIAELQRRREEECAKISDSENDLRAADGDVSGASNALDNFRAAENQARAELEANRQKVSDLQRATDQIEAEVRTARELLEEKTKSSIDISEAVAQICGGGEKTKDEGMLF